MKYIIISLLLSSQILFAQLNNFSQSNPINATDINSNFNHLKTKLENRGNTVPTINNFQAGDLIEESTLHNKLDIIKNSGININYTNPSMNNIITSEGINNMFSNMEQAIDNSDYNYWGDGSDGDLNTTSNVNVCDNTVDGDTCVMQYNNLTINSGHTLTTSVRRRGLIIYVQGDLTLNGTISMTARGAKGDPSLVGVKASGLNFARYTSTGTESGSSDISGTGTDAISVEANQNEVLNNQGKVYNFPLVGANGGARFLQFVGTNLGENGINGQTGGGASGSNYSNANLGHSGAGSAGTVFSGGAGGGGRFDDSNGINGEDAEAFGGKGGNGGGNHPWMGGGGGAGNPGGLAGQCGNDLQNQSPTNCPFPGEEGTGGLLIVMVKGNINIGSNGKIASNGSNGGGPYYYGGGSGGGSILVLHGGSLSNSGSIEANGGNSAGKGSVRVEQILK